MDEELEREQAEAIYGEDYVDVTDSVQCYEKGVTWTCDCGQGFGFKFGQKTRHCPTCHRTCIDFKADEREAPDREEEQTGLSEWM